MVWLNPVPHRFLFTRLDGNSQAIFCRHQRTTPSPRKTASKYGKCLRLVVCTVRIVGHIEVKAESTVGQNTNLHVAPGAIGHVPIGRVGEWQKEIVTSLVLK